MSLPNFYCNCTHQPLLHAVPGSSNRLECEHCGTTYRITIAVHEKGKPKESVLDHQHCSFIWGKIAGLTQAAAMLYEYSGAVSRMVKECESCGMKDILGGDAVHGNGCTTMEIEKLARKLSEQATGGTAGS